MARRRSYGTIRRHSYGTEAGHHINVTIRCAICSSSLSHFQRSRRQIICGPGGTFCRKYKNDIQLQHRIGDEMYLALRALGVKERWHRRRPRAIAAEHCHYVLITGLIRDTTAFNLEVVGQAPRLRNALNEISKEYLMQPDRADDVMPYSVFHRNGYPEAVVAFEDLEFAQAVVDVISRDDGGFFIDDDMKRWVTTIRARLLTTEDEKVDFLTRYTAERLSASVPPRRKGIQFALPTR